MRPFIFFLLSLSLCCVRVQAQTPSDTVKRIPPPRVINLGDIQREIGYPIKARDNNIQGEVYLNVFVSKGKYVKHKVLASPSPILTEAVEKHVSKIVFTTSIGNDDSLPDFWVHIPFRFVLEERKSVLTYLASIKETQALFEPIDLGLEKAELQLRLYYNLKGEYISHSVLYKSSDNIYNKVKGVIPSIQCAVPETNQKSDKRLYCNLVILFNQEKEIQQAPITPRVWILAGRGLQTRE